MFIEHNPKLRQRARTLRKEMTPEENHLWYDFLNKVRPCFLRQKPIGEYIAVFYCSKCKLVIELDGAQHNEPNALEYDRIRDAYMENMGLRVLRFSNREVNNHFERVCQRITDVIANYEEFLT